MIDRIAVVLRGAPRMWSYTKTPIFRFYESLATQVDYYWVSVYDPVLSNIHLDFQGKQLISIIAIPREEKFHNVLNISEYQRKSIIGTIKDRESKIGKYDYIIESRPDLIPHVNGDIISTAEFNQYPDQDEIGVIHVGPFNNKILPFKHGVDDTFYIAKSLTYDRFCSIPYADWDMLGWARDALWPENVVYYQCINRGLKFKHMTNLRKCIARPSALDVVPDSRDIVDHLQITLIVGADELWSRSYSDKDKQECLKRHNLDLNMYSNRLNYK